MKKLFLTIFSLSLALLLGLFLLNHGEQEETKKIAQVEDVAGVTTPEEETSLEKISESNKNSASIAEEALKKDTGKDEATKVPFTAQAPLGDWKNEYFQNGCEEASILMAIKWIDGEPIASSEDAQAEILDISKFEEEYFGFALDASLEDVGKIFSEKYGFTNFKIAKDVTTQKLIGELEKGNIILVPAFGQALGNPNFTSPGPITHMLVLVGYDAVKKEFITNDPGTRKGENYHYKENILFGAIWAYPSGKSHPPVPTSIRKKDVLIVKKS
jgi:hypothetical protein